MKRSDGGERSGLERGLGSADEAFLAEDLGIGGMQVTAITDAFDASGMPSASVVLPLSLSTRECVSRRFASSFLGGMDWGELGRARRPSARLVPSLRCRSTPLTSKLRWWSRLFARRVSPVTDAGREGEPGVNCPPRLLRLALTTSPSILTKSRRRQSSRGSNGRSGLGLKVLARLGLDLERGSCGREAAGTGIITTNRPPKRSRLLALVPGDVRSALLTKHGQARHPVIHRKALTATKNSVLPWCRA